MALAHTATWLIRSPSTRGCSTRKLTALWMSRAFSTADSTSRGTPSEAPNPVKSNDSAANPRAAIASA